MATPKQSTADQPETQTTETQTPESRRKETHYHNRRLIMAVVVCFGIYWSTGWSQPQPTNRFLMEREAVDPVDVELVQPDIGGIAREIAQTGTIEAVERAQIRARVSGYLKTINVRIGDTVQQGQVIAEIDSPELYKDVDKYSAMVEQAGSRVLQARAKIGTIAAKRESLQATVQEAQAEVERNKTQWTFHEKQLARIQQLAKQGAVQSQLVDENIQQRDSAKAGMNAASAVELGARADLNAIAAQIELAQADLAAAEADVRVARANLERARVMTAYLQIKAPFAGVVTERNYDRGDFIETASSSVEPLVDMARIDQVRAVVQVSSADVPYVRPGQQAVVTVASLGGEEFEGTVSRIAWYQNRRSRTMRVEIDLDNSERLLAGGMYGKVAISIPPADAQMTIPTSTLVGRPVNGNAKVLLVRNSVLELVDIVVGRSSGDKIEVLNGLTEKSHVATSRKAVLTASHDGFPANPTTSEVASR